MKRLKTNINGGFPLSQFVYSENEKEKVELNQGRLMAFRDKELLWCRYHILEGEDHYVPMIISSDGQLLAIEAGSDLSFNAEGRGEAKRSGGLKFRNEMEQFEANRF